MMIMINNNSYFIFNLLCKNFRKDCLISFKTPINLYNHCHYHNIYNLSKPVWVVTSLSNWNQISIHRKLQYNDQSCATCIVTNTQFNKSTNYAIYHMAWMYAIPQYDNLVFLFFLSLWCRKIISRQKCIRLLLCIYKRDFCIHLMIYFDAYS